MAHWLAGRVGTWQAVRSLLARTILFAVAWWAVAEGRPIAWPLALAGVGGASALSLLLQPPGRWTLAGVARFIPFFLVESVRGGVDVALRALSPSGRVDPGWVVHPFGTDDPDVRLVVANLLSLTPGTLSARLEGDRIIIHVLDIHSEAVRLPRTVEERASAMTKVTTARRS